MAQAAVITPNAAATDSFLDLVKARRTYYSLSAESTIPDSRIVEIVKHSITHAPSAYNVQSARAVVLFSENHAKFWDIVKTEMEPMPMPDGMKQWIMSRIAGFKASYGTVMWFEDQAALDALGEKNPMVKPMLTEWSDVSTGINQIIVWTALEAEGLGASLQHYNFLPTVTPAAIKAFDLPDTWVLKAQCVFGKPTEGPGERTYEAIDTRVLIR